MKALPPLVELRAFDAAARHMSFTKAALELGVTPTAISHQIKLLERYCGHALFRRRPRPMTLTEAGARMFPAIRSGLETFEGAIVAVRRLSQELPLRVTATNAFASRWLVPRLPEWRKLRASVPLEVIGTDSVLDLDAGDGDVAIRYATSRTGDPKGVAEVLLTDTFWPVYNPKLLAPAGLKRPADLAKYLLIHAYWAPGDRDPPTWRRWLNAARRKSVRCARIQGHAASELSRGIARHRSGNRRAGCWAVQRRAGGEGARRRHARKGVRSQLARLSLLRGPASGSSSRKANPCVRVLAKIGDLERLGQAGRLLNSASASGEREPI
jgi:LysR family transcriptional regulator, glycine cleavage system transcriptional activator